MKNHNSNGHDQLRVIEDQIQEVLLEIEWLVRKRFAIKDAAALEAIEKEIVKVTDHLASLIIAQKIQQGLEGAVLKDEAKEEKRLVDATHGRRTRSIIIMDSNHIVLSAIQAETVSQRFSTLKETS